MTPSVLHGLLKIFKKSAGTNEGNEYGDAKLSDELMKKLREKIRMNHRLHDAF